MVLAASSRFYHDFPATRMISNWQRGLEICQFIKHSNPHLRRRGIKAPQPRAQLKHKLSAKPSYNAVNDPDGIIRSYEIAPLVPILRSLSSFLTDAFKALILENIENKLECQATETEFGTLKLI